MHTQMRTMFGVGMKNSSWVIPADPRASIARSRSRGTVIFTHNRANRLGPSPSGACPDDRGLGSRVELVVPTFR